MSRLIFLFSFLSVLLMARENPFFPSSGEVDMSVTSNQVSKIEPLKRATIKLPSTARIIESVIIKYKNLDGSVSEIQEDLGNGVDWHLPIFISQSYGGVGSEPQKTKKADKYKKIAGLKFIQLYENKRSLKIKTKDKMIRNFLLTKPHRIVCDFKRDINIRSYEKDITIKNSIVQKVKLGNHKGYYRVVIELDGYYRYRLQATKNSYLFEFL